MVVGVKLKAEPVAKFFYFLFQYSQNNKELYIVVKLKGGGGDKLRKRYFYHKREKKKIEIEDVSEKILAYLTFRHLCNCLLESNRG